VEEYIDIHADRRGRSGKLHRNRDRHVRKSDQHRGDKREHSGAKLHPFGFGKSSDDSGWWEQRQQCNQRCEPGWVEQREREPGCFGRAGGCDNSTQLARCQCNQPDYADRDGERLGCCWNIPDNDQGNFWDNCEYHNNRGDHSCAELQPYVVGQ